MLGKAIIVSSLLMVLTLCFQGCIVPGNPPSTASPSSSTPAFTEAQSTPYKWSPSPPKIPQEVLSIWNLQPPSDDSLADLEGEISLKPNPDIAEAEVTNAGDMSYSVVHTPWQDTPNFQLESNQWVDVIISSLNVPIYFPEQGEGVSFQLQRIYEEPGKQGRQPIGGQTVAQTDANENEQFNSIAFAVSTGKRLYENRVTNSQEGILFTSAYRLFVGAGSEEFTDADYIIHFTNYNHQQGAEINYRLYRLGVTSSWGESYWTTQLQPWLNRLYEMYISGKISQEEYTEAENEWLRQLTN